MSNGNSANGNSANGDGSVAVRPDSPMILVADDNEDVLSLIVFHLVRTGFRLLSAADGAEALRLAEENDVDLVILDVLMPKLTGIEVCRRLRANQARAGTPILLLSARVRDSDVESGLEAGATDYITKPFSPKDLQKRVAELLSLPALPG